MGDKVDDKNPPVTTPPPNVGDKDKDNSNALNEFLAAAALLYSSQVSLLPVLSIAVQQINAVKNGILDQMTGANSATLLKLKNEAGQCDLQIQQLQTTFSTITSSSQTTGTLLSQVVNTMGQTGQQIASNF